MKIAFLQTGKTSEKHVAEGVENYFLRLEKYPGLKIITISDVRGARNLTKAEIREKEGEKILEKIYGTDYVVLLDERGREFRTVEFASWLENRLMHTGKRLLFVSGGAWGFSEEVYARADMRISLSKMTFPHQLVRLIFLEQLYRALSVIRGSPYHHE
ncbi:MAG: 23S rRNA (pseudouridine(1915)-N(3))-methyltransferase RlmH [Bacteroidales bacterium]|jgi:23S rRNA (pseudouridine1915-N3)-methyltransferase|nr:23S rRNA (pseudouridine(1915)-N(3))-methyltransferase RlmH [Bacteroidales bacterium]